MCFAALKRALGLASLRCSTIEGVLGQIWTTLVLYQVLQDLRLELAAAAGLGADDSRPRQGKPEPARPSIITVAGLRTSTGRDELGR